MEGDYLKFSQFPYYSHQSPLGTIRFLTSGIRVVNLGMGEYCDLCEILKELWHMDNEVLEKVKALAESKKVMEEELSSEMLICMSKWMMMSMFTLPFNAMCSLAYSFRF